MIRRPDQGGAAPGPGAADPCPEVRFDIAKFISEFARFGLVGYAETDAVMGAISNELSIFIIKLRD